MRAALLLVAALAASLLPVPTALADHDTEIPPDAVVVDTTDDTFDGSCDDGDCSLRDAVRSAPTRGTVAVPAGFYALDRPGGGGVGQGTIELRRRLTITAVGDTGTFVDASVLGLTAFEVAPPAGATVHLEHLTVFGARDPSLVGGAVEVSAGTLEGHGLTLTGGIARLGGGIAVGEDAHLRLDGSLLLGNEAAARGGGIWSQGEVELVASAVAGNRATDGAGIAVAASGSLALDDVTVAENIATGEGGGIWLRSDASIASATIGGNAAGSGGGLASGSRTVSIAGSIVAGNRADTGRQCARPLASGGGNVERGRTCGFDAAGDMRADPGLRPLEPAGGPTPTMALPPGSPAIDLGDDCGGRDQRGAPRGRRCDAGAYELVRCLGRPVNIVGTPGDDELSGGRGLDVFLGLGGNDEFQGSIGKDRACGGAGDDLLIAGPGADRFAGEGGNDRVKGESGDDGIWGGRGRDRLVGGPGEDTCESAREDRVARGCEVTFAGSPRAR